MFKAVTYFNFAHFLEALDFYKNKLGARIINQTMGDDEMFKDMPAEYKMPDEVAKRFVMNAEFELLGERFMVSDTMGQRPVNNEGVNVCFTFDGNDAEAVEKAEAFFQQAIAAGCEETMPLGATEWTKLYGMFKDPFGITWMVSAL
ncbi:VOC family protein [Macrococcus brunensis]|uniref:VOC family protein n=1 Tax=Macrococcus brunensis TaxID=198483 RepID=UPI001EF04DF2|nr:VOC family protein [Macrococcus brunensis]ULG74582.1 VOC family protein [Macrococcus brunensis]